MVKLMQHQKLAVELSRENPNFALFFEQGTGKTGAAISIIEDKFRAYQTELRTLILAPPAVLVQWKEEFAKFSGIHQDKILILDGSFRRRVNLMLASDAPIVITNYEFCNNLDLYNEIMDWRPQMMILDESQKCKNWASLRSKRIHRMSALSSVSHRYLLTGTPITNSAMDIFQQYKIMDQGATFGNKIGDFQREYFVDENARNPNVQFPSWRPYPWTMDKIGRLMKNKCLIKHRSECLDLPVLTRVKHMVDLTNEQKRIYKTLKKDLIAYIKEGDDSPAVAKSAAERALRLQQIVTGFVKTDDGTIEEIKNNREEALREILRGIPKSEKAIIWCCFKHNYDQVRNILKDFGQVPAELHGGITNKDKEIKKFREDYNTRFMLAHPGSGGIGVNLVEASYSIYFSKNWNLEYDLQSEARNYRRGSEVHNRITRIDLVCPGTIDELITKGLENKQNVADYILKISKEDI